MELIYSMRRKPLKSEPPHFERATDPELVRPVCTISCCNIIAFSSPTELTDSDCDTWGGQVYVCDLDTPWDSHKVVSTTHPVSALEWDGEGKQLLVATTEGEVMVFGQKDFLLNEWTCLYSATFPGEHIVKAAFFHNGRRVVMLDKKHDAPITERIQELRSAPTLKGFGGVAVPGACVITATGLVGALTADAPSRAADSLRAHRARVVCADIAHKNGSLLVAAVTVPGRGGGGAGARVRCCACALTLLPRAPHPHLALTPLPTLTTSYVPTCITWTARCEADSLLVAGTTLALWKLTERQHPVHKLLAKGPLQGSTTPGGGQKTASDCFNTVVWQQTGGWGVEAGARCCSLASTKQPGPAPHAVLATTRKLHLLARDTHHYLCSRPLPTGPEPAAASPPKKPKYGNSHYAAGSGGAVVCCADVSWGGAVVCMVDARAQVHVYRLPQPWADIPTGVSVQQAQSLLEYCMVCGFDTTDIQLTLKPPVVEMLYERLTESFQRQPPAFQQYYYHTWLKMRIALCRLLPHLSTSVSWLTCLQTLRGLWAALGAALRPDERPDDKPLAALLDDTSPDHDKALIALESKAEFPSEWGVLMALRRPLQRAVDIAVTLVAAAGQPDTHHHHGYSLVNDPAAMSLLRRILVIARGAGLGDAALSRLLQRIHQPNKPELIEECLAISAVCGARVWEALPRVCVSAPHGKPHPLYLEVGSAPDCLRVSPPAPPALYTDLTPSQQMDSIRYTYLCGAAVCRQCARCGARALPPRPAPPHPAQRAHIARMLPACRCGGKWTLVSGA